MVVDFIFRICLSENVGKFVAKHVRQSVIYIKLQLMN